MKLSADTSFLIQRKKNKLLRTHEIYKVIVLDLRYINAPMGLLTNCNNDLHSTININIFLVVEI